MSLEFQRSKMKSIIPQKFKINKKKNDISCTFWTCFFLSLGLRFVQLLCLLFVVFVFRPLSNECLDRISMLEIGLFSFFSVRDKREGDRDPLPLSFRSPCVCVCFYFIVQFHKKNLDECAVMNITNCFDQICRFILNMNSLLVYHL